MADDGLQAELALALRDGADAAAALPGLCQRLDGLRGSPRLPALVTEGPPAGGGAETWGARLAAALAGPAADGAQERAAGHWRLLAALSSARGLERAVASAYYAQFDDAALHAALLAALGVRGPWDADVRRCLRNLARSPGLRAALGPAVPALAADLGEEDAARAREAAAALCNVACHSDTKGRAVACGAVRGLVRQLGRPGLSAEAAEDFLACMGVLTGNHEPGVAALFEVAAAEGRESTLGPLVGLLAGGASPSLQCLALDVVGGLCAASPQFGAWAARETALAKRHLPELLRSEDSEVRTAALRFGATALEAEGFTEAFQKGGGVGALQSVLERDPPPGEVLEAGGPTQLMAPHLGGRRAPTQRDLARFLISKILII